MDMHMIKKSIPVKMEALCFEGVFFFSSDSLGALNMIEGTMNGVAYQSILKAIFSLWCKRA